MKSKNIIHTVSCHCEGEVGDVIIGGVRPPPGETLWEQSRYIADDGWLRNVMLNEPRGGVFRHVNFLVPPVNPQADAAFIVMEPEDTPPMSGSNSMCVATVLLETGLCEMHEPLTELVLEAPGGLVHVSARCEDGSVKSVKVRNVPSFVDLQQVALQVPGFGQITVDTAYGGDSFVIADAAQFGFSLKPSEARAVAELGLKITEAANQQLVFSHPENPDWTHFSFCQLVAATEMRGDVLHGKNSVVIQPGKLDRSPCGTGCSARMALLHAQGKLQPGELFVGESMMGSQFHCSIESVTTVGDRTAIVPSLRGRAWLTGTHQHMVDPDDPWPEGYKMSDTWGVAGFELKND